MTSLFFAASAQDVIVVGRAHRGEISILPLSPADSPLLSVRHRSSGNIVTPILNTLVPNYRGIFRIFRSFYVAI